MPREVRTVRGRQAEVRRLGWLIALLVVVAAVWGTMKVWSAKHPPTSESGLPARGVASSRRASGRGSADVNRPSLVLISLDTVRPDH